MARSTNGVVLGLNAYSHDAGAALFVDGALVFAAEEERYDRVKHSARFPRGAIAAALAHAGLEPRDVDRVVFCWRRDMAARRKLAYFLRGLPRALPFLYERPEGLPGRVGYLRAVRDLPRDLLDAGIGAPITWVSHHRAHAAQAYRFGGAETADIVVVDGMGEWETTTVWRGSDNAVGRLEERTFPESLGKLYSAVTQWLGFRPESGEGKTMGLAPYGSMAQVDRMRSLVLPRLRARRFGFAWGRTTMAA